MSKSKRKKAIGGGSGRKYAACRAMTFVTVLQSAVER